MNDVSERSSDFVHDLGAAVRKNPLSAALIGMGALWLLTNKSGPLAARDVWQGTTSAWRSAGQNLKEGARATADAASDRGSKVADRLSDAGSAFASSASEYVNAAPGVTGDVLSNARANLGELFHAQPLALGAVGLAIGAAVAASLPLSEMEGTYFGDRELVKQKAGEIAGQQAQRAVDIGKKVVDAVADEAPQQGLTAEELGTTVRDLSAKVSRVADAATKTQRK